MNTPTHVMAGALAAQTMMVYRDRYPQHKAAIVAGVAAFGLGTIFHLLLDGLPHDDWIAGLHWFPGVPFHWLLCEAVCALPLLVLGVLAGREHPVILGLGLFGGMYPDFEKVAYLGLHLPRQFVLFPAHSLKVSSYDGGWPFGWLVVLEAGLLVSMSVATVVIARWRRERGANYSREFGRIRG